MHRLGEGSFGEVFQVKDMAIKSSKIHHEIPENIRKLFNISNIREYDTLLKVQICDHCIQLRDILLNNPFHEDVLDKKDFEDIFFIMEKGVCSGATYIEMNLEKDERIMFAAQVGCALEFIHSRGIIHYDLKPENIIMFKDAKNDGYIAKLSDFGMSKIYSIQDHSASYVYPTWYRAPEVHKKQIYSFEPDIWAYGIILLELFSQLKIERSTKNLKEFNKTLIENNFDIFKFQDDVLVDLLSQIFLNYKSRISISDILNHKLFKHQRDYINNFRKQHDINNEGTWITKPIPKYYIPESKDRAKFFEYHKEFLKNDKYHLILLHTITNVDRYLKTCPEKEHTDYEIFILWNTIFLLCFKYFIFFFFECPIDIIDLKHLKHKNMYSEISEKEKHLLLYVFKGELITETFTEIINTSQPLTTPEITSLVNYLFKLKSGTYKTSDIVNDVKIKLKFLNVGHGREIAKLSRRDCSIDE